jgi:3-isopropylmalate/(R)-2-methylmalate dehydratase small subunit
MEVFLRGCGRVAAMPAANIDTDVIMPKAFLKGIDRAGLAEGLFHDLRFEVDGSLRPHFILNRSDMSDTRFLLVGPNFGCGSSREHAVWGTLQYGIQAIIGSSFGAIFSDNAANNGLLLISLPLSDIDMITSLLENDTGQLTIDIETQLIKIADVQLRFDIDPAIQRALMLGLDRIGNTLTYAENIRAFEEVYFENNPWLVEPSDS